MQVRSMPELMKAVWVPSLGGDDALSLGMRPIPNQRPDEVLVEVWVAGVNRPDVLQREGHYPPPVGTTDILGLEVMGRIARPALRGGRFRAGEPVCALVAGGGYAEYVSVPEIQCLPVPGWLGACEAAALPETVFTVWYNLRLRAHLHSREWLLVHGGGGGIGTVAVGLAAALDCHVITTTGSTEKAVRLKNLGAEQVVDYRQDDCWQALHTAGATNGGYDLILDTIGGSYFEHNLALLATEGRLVQLAFRKGSRISADLAVFLSKRLSFMGSTLRPQSPGVKGRIARSVERSVFPLLQSGKFRPVIDSVYPLAAVEKAHERIDNPAHFGKILLLTDAGASQGLQTVPPGVPGL